MRMPEGLIPRNSWELNLLLDFWIFLRYLSAEGVSVRPVSQSFLQICTAH